MNRAGCAAPSLDGDELAYTAEVIAPHLDSDKYGAQSCCLFGDESAASLGYEPLGLSARAGFAPTQLQFDA
jgi:hypothetical protein